MNLFQRAYAGLNLTPGERALLKLVQGFALAGVQSLVLAVPSVLALRADAPVISAVGFGAMAGAFVHGFLAAWAKYASAKGDAPLVSALGAVDVAAQQRLGLPAAKVETPVPPTPTAPATAASEPSAEPSAA